MENNIRIIHGDAIEEMKKLINKEDIKVDMVLTDPPYGLTQNKNDIALPFSDMWQCLDGLTNDTTPILLFSQGLFYVDLVSSNRKNFRYDIIWDKQLISGHLNAKRMPLRCHENIAVFYKKLPVYNPQFSKGIPLHSMGHSYKNKEYTNNNYGHHTYGDNLRIGATDKYPKSIISYQKPTAAKAIHPTQKPIELLEFLIKTYTNEGDSVLDFTAGSFSTAVACINTNRRFIGIEIDEKYINVGYERVNK